MYDLIEKSFGDYESMREHYLKAVGVTSDHFKRGHRAESQMDFQRSAGWVWLLYDSVGDKLVVK